MVATMSIWPLLFLALGFLANLAHGCGTFDYPYTIIQEDSFPGEPASNLKNVSINIMKIYYMLYGTCLLVG